MKLSQSSRVGSKAALITWSSAFSAFRVDACPTDHVGVGDDTLGMPHQGLWGVGTTDEERENGTA